MHRCCFCRHCCHSGTGSRCTHQTPGSVLMTEDYHEWEIYINTVLNVLVQYSGQPTRNHTSMPKADRSPRQGGMTFLTGLSTCTHTSLLWPCWREMIIFHLSKVSLFTQILKLNVLIWIQVVTDWTLSVIKVARYVCKIYVNCMSHHILSELMSRWEGWAGKGPREASRKTLGEDYICCHFKEYHTTSRLFKFLWKWILMYNSVDQNLDHSI